MSICFPFHSHNNILFVVLLKYSLFHHSFLCKTQYPSFQYSDFSNISLYRLTENILCENNSDFCVCDFTVVTEDVFTYYRVCLWFPGTQAKFS